MDGVWPGPKITIFIFPVTRAIAMRPSLCPLELYCGSVNGGATGFKNYCAVLETHGDETELISDPRTGLITCDTKNAEV